MLKHDLRVLSEQPRIYHLEKFLSFEECDHLIGLAKERLSRSYVVDPHSSNNVIDPARTSRGMTLPKTPEDPIVVSIEQRIASVTEIPVDHGENLQVLHYVVGGEYKPHYDYFDPASPGAAANLVRGGQRIATMIMYLHTTDEGGETLFPLIDVEVKPIKGNAIFFYNCKPNGCEDELTLHCGTPVVAGEKWIVTKWLRKKSVAIA